MQLENINLLLFFVFILPGLISMKVYRLVLPTTKINWNTALIEGLFFSSVTFLILAPFVYPIINSNWADFLKIISSSILILIASIGLPFLFKYLLTNTPLSEKLNLPYPKAWDYFFDLRKPCFLLIHLNNDKLIGGYYGINSYATSFPNQGDLYLEAVYKVDENGNFKNPIEDSNGLLITKDQYEYIEIFNVPETDHEE